MAMNLKSNKIHCILCKGSVAFENGDSQRFSDHLKFDHEVTDGLEWVLAGSVVTSETRQRVLQVIKKNNPLLNGNVKEKEEKPIIDIEVTEEEVVGSETAAAVDVTKENDPLDTTEANTKVKAAEKVRVSIPCNFCPYKAKSNFGMLKHVKRFHAENNAIEEKEYADGVQSGKDLESNEKVESDEISKDPEVIPVETDKSRDDIRKKRSEVFDNVHKMLIEETGGRKPKRKNK